MITQYRIPLLVYEDSIGFANELSTPQKWRYGDKPASALCAEAFFVAPGGFLP